MPNNSSTATAVFLTAVIFTNQQNQKHKDEEEERRILKRRQQQYDNCLKDWKALINNLQYDQAIQKFQDALETKINILFPEYQIACCYINKQEYLKAYKIFLKLNWSSKELPNDFNIVYKNCTDNLEKIGMQKLNQANDAYGRKDFNATKELLNEILACTPNTELGMEIIKDANKLITQLEWDKQSIDVAIEFKNGEQKLNLKNL